MHVHRKEIRNQTNAPVNVSSTASTYRSTIFSTSAFVTLYAGAKIEVSPLVLSTLAPPRYTSQYTSAHTPTNIKKAKKRTSHSHDHQPLLHTFRLNDHSERLALQIDLLRLNRARHLKVELHGPQQPGTPHIEDIRFRDGVWRREAGGEELVEVSTLGATVLEEVFGRDNVLDSEGGGAGYGVGLSEDREESMSEAD